MKKFKKNLVIFSLLFSFQLFFVMTENLYSDLFQKDHIDVISVDGVIGPVVSEYIVNSIEASEREGAIALIIQLDTPGGLDESMREIIKKILSSEIPIVVYVSPSGARAASAGVFITIAAHIAAMSPGTNIGAAHPVVMGGQKVDEEMSKKMVNDAVAYIKSIAKKRGRNEEWAEKSVSESVSITEQEALQEGVVDFIAENVDDLIKKIHNYDIVLPLGKKVLKTHEVQVRYKDAGIRYRILSAITNPNIAYILMMIGLAGLYFEFSHPGSIFPGVIGGISLILAFYSLHTLSVNYAGVLLILLGLILLIAEIKIQSYGLLAIGGIASFFLGSIMLFDSPLPYLRVSWSVIIPTLIIVASFFMLVTALAFRAYMKRSLIGLEAMQGIEGETITQISQRKGKVFIHGEYWNAFSDEDIEEGEVVEVIEVKGLKLKVKKV